MSNTLLEIRGIEAGYGGQKVLRGISLEVPEGGMVTLIGPNGHGKTTLLRTISGLVKPSGGEILLHGEKINGRRAHSIVERGIVHIPQGDMLFSDMTVYDNLMMGAYPKAAYATAGDRLATVYKLLPRLEERRNQVASTLSGGERRMLSIGRGLMANGKLLLIDEPSLGLAPLVIDQIYEVIADLKRHGISILLVEENASRVIGVADKVFLLDDGKIVWRGTPSEMEENQDILETYLGG
jgi:branched-chain amino acid transport system ATP-binding protein